MAQEVIFAEQTLNGFALKADFGLYAYDIAPAPFSLVLGESYIVVWDGETFTCEAQDMSAIIEGGLALGNLASVGGAGNNEPFIIGWTQYGVTIFAIDNESAHSMAIYQDAGESYAPNDAVILSYSKSPVHYENVPKVWLTHPESTEETPVLVPFTYGEAVSKTVEPDFSAGDMAVPIGDGELVTELTIAKPKGLVPENIAKDAVVAGIVGTHGGSGEGSGSDESTGASNPEWIDDICFWDYDGTLIQHISLSDAKSLTELPAPPDHDGLVFQGWNYTLEEIQAAEYPRDVGAIYSTSDGKTHATLVITSSSYRAVPMYFSQTVENGVTIDWGDGSTSTVAGTGVVNTAHTYSAIGTYEVVLTVADGCVLTLGSASTRSFIGGTTTTYRDYLTALFVGDGVDISTRFIQGCSYLAKLTLPNGPEEIPDFVTFSNIRLQALIIPRGVTTVGTYCGYQIGNYLTEAQTVVSLPETVETLGNGFGYALCDIWRLVIPPKIIAVPNYVAYQCYNIRRVFMSDDVTSIGDNFLYKSYAISKFDFPASVESVGIAFAYETGLREIVLPSTLTTIGNLFCEAEGLRRVVVKGAITSVGTYPLQSIKVSELVMCTQTTGLSAIKTFLSQTYYRYLYVPDDYVTNYTNMLSREYMARIYPLSKYPGKIPD